MAEKKGPEYYIFRAWRLTKDGEKLWTRDYGYKAWRIWVSTHIDVTS